MAYVLLADIHASYLIIRNNVKITFELLCHNKVVSSLSKDEATSTPILFEKKQQISMPEYTGIFILQKIDAKRLAECQAHHLSNGRSVRQIL